MAEKGSAAKISDVKRELKQLHSLSQQQVMSNLTYLIDRGWVKTVEQEKTVQVAGGTVPSVVTWYEIAAPGIEKIEGESEFKPSDRFAGININAIGSNIITLGDGNVVNVRHEELHGALDALKAEVATSIDLDESQKLEVTADIESLKDQLVKDKPNPGVLKAIWSAIEDIVTVGTLADLTMKAGVLIAPLLS